MNRIEIRNNLERLFDLNDLQSLCFDLDIPFDQLSGSNHSTKVISLVTHCEKTDQIVLLTELAKKMRPQIQWSENGKDEVIENSDDGKVNVSPRTAQLTVIIERDFSGFNKDEQRSFIWALARLAGVSPNQVKVLRVNQGSIHLTLEMPESGAQELLLHFLRKDPLLAGLKVSKIELKQNELAGELPKSNTISLSKDAIYNFSVIFGTLVFLAGLNGVIGDLANAFVSRIWGSIPSVVPIPIWLLSIAFLVLPIAATYGIVQARAAHAAAVRLNELDDSLLRFLPIVASSSDKEEATARMLDELLRDTLKLFHDGCRAAIMIPDQTDSEYLRIWRSVKVPKEVVEVTRFYIGTEARQRGIAGSSYANESLVIASIEKDRRSDKAHSRNPEYLNLERDWEEYRVIAAAPMMDAVKCRGVLCLDSENPNAFESQKTQQLLMAVASRFGTALQILESLDI